ncbi:LamG-like jellyroll fold domain-containing protein [Paraconexibacter sp. AEG42_29]|uniref:LamG-like jellyroll fold domain-containing protein n=1 Tax=Paraconexibacter sp. AEG42_29 TaxID=2997339 RepID=UPI00339D7A65
MALVCVIWAAGVPSAEARGAWPAPRDGTIRGDVMRGTDRADRLRGHGGPDVIRGRGGNDLLTGGTGGDEVAGGSGEDTITGAAGGDTLDGGPGADIVVGGFGSDRISGGSGDDNLEGSNDADVVHGGAGDDVIHGGSGPDMLFGDAGNDIVYADSGGDTLMGGPGDDTLFVDTSSPATIDCGPGEDTLYLVQPAGLSEDVPRESRRVLGCEHPLILDAIVDPNTGVRYLAPSTGGTRTGSAKDDLLLGGPGPDTLRGGAGNDVLWGLRQAGLTSTARDVLDAGAGEDTIYGGPGPQQIQAGAGDDFVNGGLGRNDIDAGPGNDTIRLRGTNISTIQGGTGDDEIYAGGPARARVRCGPGRDTVHADSGDAVAADCERIDAPRASRPQRLRAGTALRAAARVTYADLVRATADLAHWWRLGPAPALPGATPSTVRDEVTGSVGTAPGDHTEPGVTDDGDGAWLPRGPLETRVSSAPLQAPTSTLEAWVRTPSTPDAQEVLSARFAGAAVIAVTVDANGTFQALISRGSTGPDTRLAGYGSTAGQGVWHHIALTRAGGLATLYVDGVRTDSDVDADLAALPATSDLQFTSADPSTATAIDELALYTRALTAAEVAAHAGVGRESSTAPITVPDPPFGRYLQAGFATRLHTGSAGSSYQCLLDETIQLPCAERFVLPVLESGSHTLKITATDRFGRVETTPRTHTFAYARANPYTAGAAVIGVTGAVPTLLAMGSNDRQATFECALVASVYSEPTPREWIPCTSGTPLPENVTGVVRFRAVSASGLRDPTPALLQLRPRAQAASGRPGAFGGARAELQIAAEDSRPSAYPYTCALDGTPLVDCRNGNALPVLRQGTHTLQVTQQTAVLPDPIVIAPLRFTVGTPAALSLTALQFPAVVETSAALARRVPRVRLALDAPALLTLTITRGDGRQVTSSVTVGTAGPNTVKIPASALRRLALGRYQLEVTAAGVATPPAAARVPFAIIPRER